MIQRENSTMKSGLRLLLVLGVMAVSLAYLAPLAEAGPGRRGWRGGYGWGRAYPRAGWGYRQAYRPYGFGPAYRGMAPGFAPYGVGFGGYPGVYGNYGYSGYGLGYPGLYGGSMIIGGSPLTGYYSAGFPY